jgi:polysaccharide export outer membrane protein
MFSHVCLTRIGRPLVLTAVGIFAGCVGVQGQEVAATASVAGTNQPASPAAVQADNSIWVLSPNDEIVMTVFQEDDLSTKTTVDVDGMVMLPLVGEVKVGGMTLAQATARIQQLYDKDYLVNPQVNLIVDKFAERHFAVLGQVQRPGSFDFPQNEPVSLLEAIAMAGGYTRLGAPSKVSVRRVVNGATQIYRLDADQLAQDLKKKNFQVLPNDVITVGERTF